jgi:hypothetical protein
MVKGMRTSMRLTAYALGLIMIFGGAVGAARLLGPNEKPEERPEGTQRLPATHAGEQHAGHEPISGQLPAGLQVSQDGYTLSPVTPRLAAGRAQTFAFRILGPDGKAVTQYTPEQYTADQGTTQQGTTDPGTTQQSSPQEGTELHLIVVRRDLAGYQHLHPTRAADGTWSVPLTAGAPGDYRVFADFTPRARTDNFVLGADVPAAGDYQPRELPKPSWSTEVDGYTVTRAGEPRAGAESWMTVSISKGGQPVTLEPHLGSFGHLVALRQGDLAYLHLHAQEGTTAGPDVTFDARVPSAGTYRLFLEFRHGGKVHLAEFTAITSAAHAHN